MPPQPVYCSENNLFRVQAGYDDLKRPPYDSSRAGRGRVGQAGWLLQNFSPPGTFSFVCQKRTRKAPATFEAREAAGCGSLRLLCALRGTRILISAIYAQSEAESIPNRLSRFNVPSQNPPARLRRSGGAPVSAPASRRIPGGTVPETAPAPAAVRCRSPSKSRTSRW